MLNMHRKRFRETEKLTVLAQHMESLKRNETEMFGKGVR